MFLPCSSFPLLKCSGGFFIESDTIPNWLQWVQYISFVFYGFNALVDNQFPSNSTGVRLDARVQIGPSGIPFWVNVAALAGIVLASKIMGYLFLHYLRGPKFLKF